MSSELTFKNPELKARIVLLKDMETVRGRIGCLLVPTLIAVPLYLFGRLHLPWQAVAINTIGAAGPAGMILANFFLLRSVQDPNMRQAIPKKIRYFSVFLSIFLIVEFSLHYFTRLNWLLSGVAGLIAAILLSRRFYVDVRPPSDGLTVWADRLLRLQSNEFDFRSKAQDEILSEARADDPVLKEIASDVILSLPYEKWRSFSKSLDVSVLFRLIQNEDTKLRSHAIKFLSQNTTELLPMDQQTVHFLMESLNNDELGFDASRVLGRVRPVTTEVVSHLVAVIERTNTSTSRSVDNAVFALELMGPGAGQAIPALTKRYEEATDRASRNVFADALEKIQGTRPAPIEEEVSEEEVVSEGRVTAGDLDAIAGYWSSEARLWWARQSRDEAICDICNSPIQKNAGYLSGAKLICSRCSDRWLGEGALEKLILDPNYFGTGVLQKARDFAAGVSAPAETRAAMSVPEEAASVDQTSAFGLVLVIGEELLSTTPIYNQAKEMLVRSVAEKPHFPLRSDASIRTLTGPTLPEENKSALQGVVWGLRRRFGRAGARWQADFHDVLGFRFLVLYLE